MRYPHVGHIAVGDTAMVASACLGTRGPKQVAVTAALMIPLDDETVTDDVRSAVETIRAWWVAQVTSRADDLMTLGTDAWVEGSQP